MPKTNSTPRTFGVIGDPVEHSLSPTIHNAAFKAHHIHAVYLRLHVRPRHLHNVLSAMTLADIEGCNVTTPHKQTIISFLNKLDASARIAGAVNTIYRRGHRWIGANTDGAGFISACRRHNVTLKGKTVTILGAGGVASAILAALQMAQLHRIIILNRSPARARRLRTRLFKKSKTYVTVAKITAASYRRYFPETDILIHATSVGLGKSRPLAIPLRYLPKPAVVCDCQYYPRHRTPLIAMARQWGHRVVEGLDLLLGQAEESYRLWMGRPAPFPAMRRAVLKNTRLG